jgi:NTP pyrophosphatase (non-canonical NTP hydrolase)
MNHATSHLTALVVHANGGKKMDGIFLVHQIGNNQRRNKTMSNLNLSEFRTVNVQRCEESYFPLDSKDGPWWGNAMAGEVGEACNVVKKIDRDGSTPERIQDLADELADVVTYADLLAARYGINLAEAIKSKFNEVSKRVNSTIFINHE